MRSRGRRGLAGETASWVMLGASLTIIPWLVCYALAKLIVAGVI